MSRPAAVTIGDDVRHCAGLLTAWRAQGAAVLFIPEEGKPIDQAGIVQEVIVSADKLINTLPVSVLVYPIALIGLWLIFRRCRTAGVVLAVVLVTTILILFPFRVRHHYMSAKFLTTMQPVIWTGLAIVPLVIKRRWLQVVAAVLVIGFVGLQSWQAVNIHRWSGWKDRYEILPATFAVKAQMQKGDVLIYDPDWMHVTAFRCGFKMDWPLKLALMEQPEVALSQKLPVNYTRPPATWMIASLMHVDENWRDVQSELRALSNWYGVEADLSPVKRYMELNHTLVAKISADGVVLRSVAPGQLSGRP